jgi:hypothetical protein
MYCKNDMMVDNGNQNRYNVKLACPRLISGLLGTHCGKVTSLRGISHTHYCLRVLWEVEEERF